MQPLTLHEHLMSGWLNHSWWTYAGSTPDGFTKIYHWMNLIEGTAWWVIAMLVLARYARLGRSWLELVYAFAFATFGVTDFVEAYQLQTWLILAKGINLVVLWRLGSSLLGRFHPQWRVF